MKSNNRYNDSSLQWSQQVKTFQETHFRPPGLGTTRIPGMLESHDFVGLEPNRSKADPSPHVGKLRFRGCGAKWIQMDPRPDPSKMATCSLHIAHFSVQVDPRPDPSKIATFPMQIVYFSLSHRFQRQCSEDLSQNRNFEGLGAIIRKIRGAVSHPPYVYMWKSRCLSRDGYGIYIYI